MNKELLGVVIPVYNVEPYLEKCIESIIKQTYSEFELILVDDGSVDDSYKICQKYAESDERISCFHFDVSQGAMKARQKGTEFIQTKYIMYMDSDDWLELNTFEKMMEAILDSEADMVIPLGRFHEFVNEGRQVTTKDLIAPGIYKDAEVDEIRKKMISVDVWPMLANRIYRTEKIMPYLLKANPNIMINNDITCVLMCMMHINSVVVIDETFYHYRKNEKSITNSYKTEYLKSNCLMYQNVKNEMLLTKKEELVFDWKKHFLNKLFMNIRMECSMENKINVFKKIKHLRELYEETALWDCFDLEDDFNYIGRDAVIWKMVKNKKTWILFFYLKLDALKGYMKQA